MLENEFDFRFTTSNSNLEQSPRLFFENWIYESILPDPSCFFVFPGNETCGFQGTSNQIPCDILDIHENKAVFSLVESVFPWSAVCFTSAQKLRTLNDVSNPYENCSVRPKPLFWFRSDTETQIDRYFWPIPQPCMYVCFPLLILRSKMFPTR